MLRFIAGCSVRFATTGFDVENILERHCDVRIPSFSSFVTLLPFISSFSSLLRTVFLVLPLVLISSIRIISFPTLAELFLFVLLSFCMHIFQSELETDCTSSSSIEVVPLLPLCAFTACAQITSRLFSSYKFSVYLTLQHSVYDLRYCYTCVDANRHAPRSEQADRSSYRPVSYLEN
jgi:hypothetical protein